MKRLNIKDFCDRSNIKHNSMYDYSIVEYKNNRTKVKIICREHGIFEQIPETHMRGIGCPKCSNNHNYTTDEYKSKLISIFGDRYLYDKLEYINQKTKVKIICREHGIVEKFPQVLLNGSGCGKCETRNFKIDTEEFINRSNKIHKNLYNYDFVEYKNDRTPVKIVCNKHGLFEQTPNSHLSGHGCIFCSGRYRYSNLEFIKLSNEIHKYKYTYDLVEYKNSHKKVKIVCPKHGKFEQKPNSHLLGKGCPSCKESKGELVIYNFLIKNNINHIRQKTFINCKYKSLLFFDFYIPEKNLCIEYDGEFHFIPIYGKKHLEDTKIRDNIKNLYCQSNNINLIRISYTNFDNIENILESLNLKNFQK
jgi:Zn finger protein HypA/HybF involved in hydrogenase expression